MPAIFWPGLGNRWEHVIPMIPTQQLSLSLDPGLEHRHPSLRDCVASQVYQRGLVTVAGKLDLSPSKLTEKLAGMDSGGNKRGLSVDELEDYIAKYGDVTPILYLAAKYCRDPRVQQAEALARLAELANNLPGLLAAAGLNKAGAKSR